MPSLVVTAADGLVLIDCHAGCHTEDVLKAIGLTLADLYDEPHRPPVERPGRAAMHDAIGAAHGLAVADRYLYLSLLWLTDYDTATIPPRFQPKNQRDLAAKTGLGRSTVEWATAHLVRHGWITLTCGRDGCERTGPHTGPGHRLHYALHFGQDCPGEDCRVTCRAVRAGTRPARLAAR